MQHSHLLVLTLALALCGCSDGAFDTDPIPDEDGDGFDEREDCDDRDAAAYPGAPETADDGVDQDCDGLDSLTVHGHRDDADSTTLVAEFIIGNAIEVTNDLRVSHLGFAVRQDSPPGRARIALYSDDVGRPTDLIAYGEVDALVQGANEVELAEPVVIEAGAWWVQLITSDTVEIGAGPDEMVVYRDLLFSDPLPDPYGVGSDYVGPRISLFLVGDLP